MVELNGLLFAILLLTFPLAVIVVVINVVRHLNYREFAAALQLLGLFAFVLLLFGLGLTTWAPSFLVLSLTKLDALAGLFGRVVDRYPSVPILLGPLVGTGAAVLLLYGVRGRSTEVYREPSPGVLRGHFAYTVHNFLAIARFARSRLPDKALITSFLMLMILVGASLLYVVQRSGTNIDATSTGLGTDATTNLDAAGEPTEEPLPAVAHTIATGTAGLTAQPTATNTASPPSPTLALIFFKITGSGGLDVNVREQPSTSASSIASLREGAKVKSAAAGTVQDSGLVWQKIDDGKGNVGWMAAQYLQPVDVFGHVRISDAGDQGVLLREEPGKSGLIAGLAHDGERFGVIGPTVEADGLNWRNVRDARGNSCWIVTDYLTDDN